MSHRARVVAISLVVASSAILAASRGASWIRTPQAPAEPEIARIDGMPAFAFDEIRSRLARRGLPATDDDVREHVEGLNRRVRSANEALAARDVEIRTLYERGDAAAASALEQRLIREHL